MNCKKCIGNRIDWRGVLKVLVAVAIVAQVFLLAVTCMYTFYTADDYWHAMVAGGPQDSVGDLVSTAWSFNIYRYIGWNGIYLTMFLQVLFCPLNMASVDIYTGLHVVLLLNWLLFAGVTWLVVQRIVRWLGISSRWGRLGCYAIWLTTYLNMYSYSEDFLWFSGATSYTMPMICVGAGLFLYLPRCSGRDAARTNGAARVLLSSALLFLGAGGALGIAMAMCWMLLGLVIYQVRSGHHGRMQVFLPAAVAYIGTFINGIAPGNYARLATTEGGA